MTKPAQKEFKDLSAKEKGQHLFAKATHLHKQNQFGEALKFYAQSVAFYPAQPDAYNNMAVALRKLQRFDAALACYHKSLTLRDDHAGTYSNMGNVLNDLDRIDQAIEAHEKAVALKPDDLLYLYNKALVLRDAGRCDEAIRDFETILEKDPNYKDCRWDMALTYLMKGDLKTGFANYDARWNLDKSPPRDFQQPRWEGENIQGKTLFIHREQGFGDAIQFVRLLPELKKRTDATIILECQPELVKLFKDLDGVDQLVMFGSTPPAFDYWVPLLSLGHLLDVVEDNIPGTIPYLTPPTESRFRLRPAPKGGLNIGICWGGSPTHQNDRRRSVNIERFMPLSGYKDVTVFSLQKGDRAQELLQSGGSCLFIDAGRDVQDFADSAAIINQLDLVITIDTSVAHLAGGLGKPVWLLLPFTPDWRWMLHREDTPWYPDMRIFRQDSPGDWDSAFDKLYSALNDKLLLS
ncbi:tetratricopeptide repeat-containing glycosyltransferase family protein [Terasakiella sp. A23]|uniref:tetratricopeptide repeat-containing glycosyltransferase family protein n=1 Tax=Terasakiella sp. FCG-A23 TaxID=3080561 RepID=UPI0029552600|nr:tetratricopeptide repeat-containing glycosyltransferase family protein [Terasakiella sp. A23]MDV7340504.1 tetratricopeptide repeat-containing glycosyltransferase family protein [Terasakiella sp. A23]